MVTHVGFLPPDPKHTDYIGTVEALKRVADACGAHGIHFLFETGQETPVVLIRCMQDIGRPNLGVNLDPANLLMYGNANPVDALDLLGPTSGTFMPRTATTPQTAAISGPRECSAKAASTFPLSSPSSSPSATPAPSPSSERSADPSSRWTSRKRSIC